MSFRKPAKEKMGTVIGLALFTLLGVGAYRDHFRPIRFIPTFLYDFNGDGKDDALVITTNHDRGEDECYGVGIYDGNNLRKITVTNNFYFPNVRTEYIARGCPDLIEGLRFGMHQSPDGAFLCTMQKKGDCAYFNFYPRTRQGLGESVGQLQHDSRKATPYVVPFRDSKN